MFELPEETIYLWSYEASNINDPGGFMRRERLQEINNAIENLRDELLHCSPYEEGYIEEGYIYEQIRDLEQRKERIELSLFW